MSNIPSIICKDTLVPLTYNIRGNEVKSDFAELFEEHKDVKEAFSEFLKKEKINKNIPMFTISDTDYLGYQKLDGTYFYVNLFGYHKNDKGEITFNTL